MTRASSEVPTLETLLSLPADDRMTRLHETGDAVAALSHVVDEAEALAMGDLARGLEALATLTVLADGLDDAALRAKSRRIHANALAYANRYEEALVALDAAVALAESGGEKVEAARGRMTSLHALARQGRFDEALRAGEAARHAFVEAGDTVLAAKADINLGAVHRMTDDPATALIHYDRARPAFRNDHVIAAQLDSNRAEALLDLCRFAEAEAAFGHALALFERAGMGRAAAIVAGNLADLMSRQGRLETALGLFERALAHLRDEPESVERARVQAELGELLLTLGDRGHAIRHFEAALPPLRDRTMAFETARALAGYGRALSETDRAVEGEAVLAEAAAAFRALGHHSGFARVKLLEGAGHRRAERVDAARTAWRDALEALDGRPLDAAVVRWHLATLPAEPGAADARRALIEHALRDVRAADHKPLLAEMLLARARLRPGDEGLADLREAVGLVEVLLDRLPGRAFRTSFLVERLDAYEALVAALAPRDGGPGDPARAREAFAVAERAKSRPVLELLCAPAIDTPADDAADALPAEPLRDEITRMRHELNVLYGDALDWRAASATTDRAAIRKREERLEELERRLSARRGVDDDVVAPAVDVDRVQAELPAHTVLVEYFIAQDQVSVFTADIGGVHWEHGIATRAAVENAIDRLGFQLRRARAWTAAGRPVDDALMRHARTAARAVYDLLIAPIRARLEPFERLVIVPHGALHGLSFAALHDGERSLLERYRITHAPSAGAFVHLRSRHHAPARGTSVVVGVSDEAAPEIRAEMTAVAAVLDDAIVLDGNAATVERVTEAIDGAAVVHFACHGRFTGDAPMGSGVRMADRWLTVREIHDLPLRGSAVVLSGCETGLARVGRAEELVGLVRAFLAAGAGAVVCSLWPVDDRVSRILMADVYEAWQNRGGERPALDEALRNAQLEVAKETPHPLFWAPFVLVGGD